MKVFLRMNEFWKSTASFALCTAIALGATLFFPGVEVYLSNRPEFMLSCSGAIVFFSLSFFGPSGIFVGKTFRTSI